MYVSLAVSSGCQIVQEPLDWTTLRNVCCRCAALSQQTHCFTLRQKVLASALDQREDTAKKGVSAWLSLLHHNTEG